MGLWAITGLFYWVTTVTRHQSRHWCLFQQNSRGTGNFRGGRADVVFSVSPWHSQVSSWPMGERMWCLVLFHLCPPARAVTQLFLLFLPLSFGISTSGCDLLTYWAHPGSFLLMFTGSYPFSTVIQCDGCRDSQCVGSHGWYIGIASHWLIDFFIAAIVNNTSVTLFQN